MSNNTFKQADATSRKVSGYQYTVPVLDSEQSEAKTVDILSRYLFVCALSSVMQDIEEIAGRDGMKFEEPKFVYNKVSTRQSDDEESEEEEDEDEDEDEDDDEYEEEYGEDEEYDDDEEADEEYDENDEDDEDEEDDDEEADEEEDNSRKRK